MIFPLSPMRKKPCCELLDGCLRGRMHGVMRKGAGPTLLLRLPGLLAVIRGDRQREKRGAASCLEGRLASFTHYLPLPVYPGIFKLAPTSLVW